MNEDLKLPPGIVQARASVAAAASKKQPTQAATLVKLAHRLYQVVVDQSGQPLAVPKQGARIAIPLQGKGNALSKRLLYEFFNRYNKTPTATALSDAIHILDAESMDQERVPVHLRCARTDARLVIDLGDATGRAVVVADGEWKVLRSPPPGTVFRRTRMTAALPKPSRRGDLDPLRDLINVSDESWDLIRAWLVLAWMPHVPVPLLAITGPQGAGKSVLGRTLVSVVDPAPAPLRSAPRDLGEWQTTAAASRVVGLDNISKIGDWFSDALCRGVTGEGAAKRQLYTDEDLIVNSFRRAIVLTSIDPGSLKGDLGERLMPVELPRLKRSRRGEADLDDALRRRLPAILGGLLDLVAEVLANPVELNGQGPRMLDAAKVMASVDAALGADALGAYNRGQARVVETVLESDPLATAVLDFMREGDGAEWTGRPTDLLRQLAVHRDFDAANWPANARRMSERLNRLAPALRDAHRLDVSWPPRGTARRIRLRWLTRPARKRTTKPKVVFRGGGRTT
jgi:hypothetical protein